MFYDGHDTNAVFRLDSLRVSRTISFAITPIKLQTLRRLHSVGDRVKRSKAVKAQGRGIPACRGRFNGIKRVASA